MEAGTTKQRTEGLLTHRCCVHGRLGYQSSHGRLDSASHGFSNLLAHDRSLHDCFVGEPDLFQTRGDRVGDRIGVDCFGNDFGIDGVRDGVCCDR